MDADKKIQELLEKGAIIADIYFDIHAKDKEELQQLAVGLSKQIAGEEGVLYSTFEIEEPIENNGVFSTYIEGRLLTDDFLSLVKIMLKYSPVGVEVIKPERIELGLGEASEILMEISKHSYDYKFYIYSKAASEEERKRILQSYENRVEIGKKLLKKEGDNEDNKSG